MMTAGVLRVEGGGRPKRAKHMLRNTIVSNGIKLNRILPGKKCDKYSTCGILRIMWSANVGGRTILFVFMRPDWDGDHIKRNKPRRVGIEKI